MPYKLIPGFQPYAWGDTAYIQTLCNLPELYGKPLAEMWLGSHPKAPSRLAIDGVNTPLNEFISANTASSLGKAANVFDTKLPFLLKVLAAEKALSIQIHPDKESAETGFAAENALGIDFDNPKRSFKDANHKPELLCALTDFTVMCGFRSYGGIVDNFTIFEVNHLWPSFAYFAANRTRSSLKLLFLEILSSPADVLETFCKTMQATANVINPAQDLLHKVCCELIDQYALDPGVVAPLLLNLAVLKPGEAIYLPAGIMHAYIKGAGIELMANSDNVIRGGLTPKYIDQNKLLELADFQEFILKPITCSRIDETDCVYPTEAKEFELHKLELDGSYNFASNNAPQIILCLEGEFSCNNELFVLKGEAIFVCAGEAVMLLSGKASLFVATLPQRKV